MVLSRCLGEKKKYLLLHIDENLEVAGGDKIKIIVLPVRSP
jgi:hypothetical protein